MVVSQHKPLLNRKEENKMRKIYSISYDLNTPGQKYDDLYKVIESYDHYKIMKSHYLVYTDSNVNQIYNKLSTCIDKNDRIFVAEVNSNRQGWLSQAAWDWIKARS